MSISRAVYVSCDDCGAAGPVDCYEGAKGARGLARHREGFARVKVNGVLKDLCRDCLRRLGL